MKRALLPLVVLSALAAQVLAPPLRAFKDRRASGDDPLNLHRAHKRARAIELERAVFNRTKDKAFRAELALFDDARVTVAFDAPRLWKDGRTATWYGRLEGSGFGEAYVVEHDQVISGHVFLDDGRVFELTTLASGAWVREIDLNEIHESAADAVAPPGELLAASAKAPPATIAPQEPAADEATTVDVMVVYTPAARNRAGGQAQIEALVREGIALANQSYANSNITQRLRLVHTQVVNYTENGDMGKDLDAITSPTDGAIDEIHALRNQYGADFVSLWVEYSDQAGIGWMNRTRSTAFERLGFHVTSRIAAVANRTFPHELGHNMGAEHDKANSTGTGMFPYSFGLQQVARAPFYRTIMAYGCSAGINCPRVSYFSNPEVSFQGQPTGVAATATNPADNRQTFNNSIQWTANFRTSATSTPSGPALTVDPKQFDVPAAGGTGTFRITGTGAWRVQNPNGWLRLSADSGNGNASVTFTAAANLDATARIGTLTVGTELINIRQAASDGNRCTTLPLPSGPAQPGTLSTASCTSPIRTTSYAQLYTFAGSAGQQIALTAVSSQFEPYLILTGPDGVIVQQGGTRLPAVSGFLTLPATGIYTVDLNTAAARATGNYTLQLSNAPAVTCSINFLPTSLRVGAGAGQGSANVTAPAGCPWTATTSTAWLRLNSSSGAGNGSVFFDVQANPGTTERSGTIIVGGKVFTVIQAAAAANCAVTPITPGQTVRGQVTATGCRAQFRGNDYYAARYSFDGRPAQRIQIAQRSSALDSYLYLLGPDGRILEEDDDSAGGVDAKIPGDEEFLGLPAAGRYIIEVTSFDPQKAGAFELTLAEAPAPTAGRTLVSGEPFSVTLPAVSTGTLFTDGAFEITVPEGATRLEITARAANVAHDIDLYVRYGQAPDVASSRVVTDYRSEGDLGDERLVIDATSRPPLRPGRYFIGLGQFTLDTESAVTVTATVTQGSTSRYTLRESSLSRTTPSGCATPPAAASFRPTDQRAVFYFIGDAAAGGVARAEFIDPSGNRIANETFEPQPEDGAFCRWAWVDLAGTPNSGRLGRWTVRALWDENVILQTNFVLENPSGGGPVNATVLTSGQPRNFALPAVNTPTVFGNAQMYRIDVPTGATRLEIVLNTTTPNADLDLYARLTDAPTAAGTTIIADHASESLTGNERILIDRTSNPPLRPGTYFIAIAAYTTGVATQGSIVASVDAPSVANIRQAVIANTQPSRTSCAAPPAADRLLPSDARAYAWFLVDGPRGESPRVEWLDPAGQTASISNFDAQPAAGTYCYESSLPIGGTLTASRFGRWLVRISWGDRVLRELFFTLDNPATPGVGLTASVPRAWSLPAVDSPVLMAASAAFRLDVPLNATRLEARLETATAAVDVDLYARFGSAPVVQNGRVQADYASESDGGNELIVLTPNSRPVGLQTGLWYFSMAVFTAGKASQGTLTVSYFLAGQDEPVRVKVPVVFEERSFAAEELPKGKAKRWVTPAERVVGRRWRLGAPAAP